MYVCMFLICIYIWMYMCTCNCRCMHMCLYMHMHAQMLNAVLLYYTGLDMAIQSQMDTAYMYMTS